MPLSFAKNLSGWIPGRASSKNGVPVLRWLYTGQRPFTDPFFEETLRVCMALPENNVVHTDPEGKILLAAGCPGAIAPDALIFHVSRCGSTLLAQALGLHREHISLAEVPVFDDLLRMHFRGEITEETLNALLAASIRMYGARRLGSEQRMFIKTDSWHLFFYKQMRHLYPHVPTVIMYREPAAVLRSNLRRQGMQAAFGVVEPALLGLADIPAAHRHPAVYMQEVLKKYYEAIIEIARSNSNVLLLNYNEGLPAQMEQLTAATRINMDEAYKAAIAARSQYHAKYQHEVFVEKNTENLIDARALDGLQILYYQIEEMRLKQTL